MLQFDRRMRLRRREATGGLDAGAAPGAAVTDCWTINSAAKNPATAAHADEIIALLRRIDAKLGVMGATRRAA